MIKLRRRDTDGLVAGHRAEADPRLDDVDAFLDAMRAEFGATPPPEPRPTLASTLDARRPLRPAAGPRVHPTFPDRRRRPHVLRPVAAFAAAGVMLFGGLATAGALPGPVQRATADVTSHVGIHLPGLADAHSDARVEIEPDHTRTPRTTVPRAGTRTGPTVPTAPNAPAPAPTTVPAPSSPTVPTVPSLPLPAPAPTPVPNLLGPVLAPLAPTGPTGPEGPTAPHPVRDLLDHLVP